MLNQTYVGKYHFVFLSQHVQIALLGDADEIVKSIFKHLDWPSCPMKVRQKLRVEQSAVPREHLIHPFVI